MQVLMQETNPLPSASINATSEAQVAFRDSLITHMKRNLNGRDDLLDRLVPAYPAGCVRLPSAGANYLRALTLPNVELYLDEIADITSDGIRMRSRGEIQEYDLIVCATGFKPTDFVPSFPVTGRSERTLADHYAEYPSTYLGITTNGFPNYFTPYGPHTVCFGNVGFNAEAKCLYVAQCLEYLYQHGHPTMEPKKEAVIGFRNCLEMRFEGKIWSHKAGCGRSFTKGSGAQQMPTVIWPGTLPNLLCSLRRRLIEFDAGTCFHALEVAATPRWSDFDFDSASTDPQFRNEKAKEVQDRLGDGTSKLNQDGQDKMYFLDRVNIPAPPLH